MSSLDKILQKEYFNIQDLAEITKRKTQTIRSWEKKGIIPSADQRSENNWRLYSKQCMIDVLEKIMNYPWERQVIKNQAEVQYVIDTLKGQNG
jgi:Predicted transcriptional regulators